MQLVTGIPPLDVQLIAHESLVALEADLVSPTRSFENKCTAMSCAFADLPLGLNPQALQVSHVATPHYSQVARNDTRSIR